MIFTWVSFLSSLEKIPLNMQIDFILQITPPTEQASQGQTPSSQCVEIGTPIQSPCVQSPSPTRSEGSTLSVVSSEVSATSYTVTFTIPSKWRPSIMKAIEEKKLTPEIRNEVV